MCEDQTVDGSGRPVMKSLEDINAYIEKNFPDGLKVKRKTDFFEGGAFIGFNLCRYAYTDLLAAECHAMRDTFEGRIGHSYGFPFKPHVRTHKGEDGEEWYEVYTG
tara:strand:- start:228 stop:545 length:318 start_codon:yes stop_codon:yes gene_type:complete